MLFPSLTLGSYALRDLVGNLPCGQQHPAKNLEGDTVVSLLNTIHEIITDSPENARALIQGHAVQKLVSINKSRYHPPTLGMKVPGACGILLPPPGVVGLGNVTMAVITQI